MWNVSFTNSLFENDLKTVFHLGRQVMDESVNNDPTNNNSNDETRRIATWSALATHMTPSIQRVVEFAKRVPGSY